MARRLCQFLLALAVLYGLAVGAFALFGYEGARPDVVTIATDMHAWVRDTLSYKYEPPDGSPPRVEPVTVKDPSPAPPPPPPSPRKDPRTEAYERVTKELLPRAQEQVKAMPDHSSPDFEIRRTAVIVTLNQARDLLAPYVDSGQADEEMRRLLQRVSELLTAVRKR